MKRTLAVIMLFAMVIFAFAACGDDAKEQKVKNKNTIIGTWEGTLDDVLMTYSFNEDGTGAAEVMGAKVEYTWTAKDGKLNAEGTFMGETEKIFDNAEYKLENGKLIITQQGETVVFTRKSGSSDNADKNNGFFDEPGTVTDPIVGTWEFTQDGITMTVTFDEGGTGKIDFSGISMSMTWSTSGDTVNAEISFNGETEMFLDNAEYLIEGSTMYVSQEGETITFTKK